MLRKKNDKLRLTREEEFELLKLVFDKFLWLGTIGLAAGTYMLLTNENIWFGLLITFIGAMILMLFTAIVMREFHLHRKF
ncbi:MAG: hypothetical protein ACMXX9_04005 [Candidatus Woesearchaeota archaeon]